jgi:hypothetical protein
MTEKEFFKKLANGKKDILQAFVDLLKKEKIGFCVIGGLGVNAYVEPVVSLDLDVVIVGEKLEKVLPKLKKQYKVEKFSNSINVSGKKFDLRIHIQTDERYQPFIQRAKVKNVLGYKLPVAAIEDVFQGKVWAAMDETRRPSGALLKMKRRQLAEVKRRPKGSSILMKAAKRQKDLADILRLVETKDELRKYLPEELKEQLRLN